MIYDEALNVPGKFEIGVFLEKWNVPGKVEMWNW